MTNLFINAINNNKKIHPITAYFKDGTSAEYTTDILNLLKTDKDVTCITDGETGEIIFEKEA